MISEISALNSTNSPSKQAGIPQPEAEWRFHPTRRFRWDFAWVKERVALEVQGGIWVGGKHGRGIGVRKDMDKATEGAKLGWRVIYCEPRELCKKKVEEDIKAALAATPKT